MVSRFAHILLIACLSLMAAVAPLLANKVVCTTDTGHQAIEVAHDANGCIVVANTDGARGDGSKTPCDDQPLGKSDTTVQNSRQSDHSISIVIAYAWSICFYFPTVDAIQSQFPFAYSSDLLPSALSQSGLSTIVLLI